MNEYLNINCKTLKLIKNKNVQQKIKMAFIGNIMALRGCLN
jgi:hypothetical protein